MASCARAGATRPAAGPSLGHGANGADVAADRDAIGFRHVWGRPPRRHPTRRSPSWNFEIRCVAPQAVRDNYGPASRRGPNLVDLGPIFTEFGKLLVDSGPIAAHSGPNLAEVGRCRSQIGAKFVDFGTHVHRSWLNFGPPEAEFGRPKFAEIGRIWPQIGRNRPNLAQLWSIQGQIGIFWSKLSDVWHTVPKSAELDRFRPYILQNLGDFDRIRNSIVYTALAPEH